MSDTKVLLRLGYREFKRTHSVTRRTRNAVVQYPVTGTRRTRNVVFQYPVTGTRRTRNLVIQYPVTGTRRSHLTAMRERAGGRASFREYEDSRQCQGVVILDLPIEGLQSNDENNTRTIRLENEDTAEALHDIIRLGRLSGRYIKDIPREIKRDEWAIVCRLPVWQAKLSITPR